MTEDLRTNVLLYIYHTPIIRIARGNFLCKHTKIAINPLSPATKFTRYEALKWGQQNWMNSVTRWIPHNGSLLWLQKSNTNWIPQRAFTVTQFVAIQLGCLILESGTGCSRSNNWTIYNELVHFEPHAKCALCMFYFTSYSERFYSTHAKLIQIAMIVMRLNNTQQLWQGCTDAQLNPCPSWHLNFQTANCELCNQRSLTFLMPKHDNEPEWH